MKDHNDIEKKGFPTVPEPEQVNTHLGSPEVTDCASDAIPHGTVPETPKKKIMVPDLLSMWKYLLSKHHGNQRLPIYSYLNRMLRNGQLSRTVGFKVLNKVINKEVLNLENVDLLNISRTQFYANVHIQLKLASETGTREWKGYLVILCAFPVDQLFTCWIEELSASPENVNDRTLFKTNPFLVPYYTNRKMDEIAERIWKEYGMEEALTDPKERDALELAKRMGLRIEYHDIYEHQGVKSILFFQESELLVGEDREICHDNGKKEHKKAPRGHIVVIPANTIVVNTNKIHRDYSDFCIYHECIHFYLHYLFFRLQQMGSNDSRQVKTIEYEIKDGQEYKDPIYFMEKQADRGAYGLMMPLTHTRKVIHERIESIKDYGNRGELFERVGNSIIDDQHIADFRVKARMIQLGHIEAKGALNRVDRKRIQPFAFNPDAWKEHELSYVVDSITVEKLRRENKDFRAFIDSGKYIYADGHVVRNDPRYVERYFGDIYYLTEEARKQVDACCLRFNRQYVQRGVGQYIYGRMFYDPQYVERTQFYLSDYINGKHMDELDARMAYQDEFPRKFVEAFDLLMKKNGYSRESVAPLLNTTERSLHDWLYRTDRKITRDFIVYISLMWKVPDWISAMLLQRAGLTMSEYDRRHQALEYIRTVLWDQGIEEANKYLKSKGLEPLEV